MENTYEKLNQYTIDKNYNVSTDNDFDSVKKDFKTCVKPNTNPQQPSPQYGFSESLNKYRNHIDNIKNDDWKKVRWFINDYDFLVKDPIINRAFYKYWEIINEFEIFEHYIESDIILHCAEAPGGFIQGSNIYLQTDRINPYEIQQNDLSNNHINNSNKYSTNYSNKTIKKEPDENGFIEVQKKKRKSKYENIKIYTISLNKDLPQYKTYNLPSYNKNVINKYVHVTYGKDNTGDINNLENVHYIKDISKRDFYLITADGGFDEGTDFNNKEQLHYLLILSEIYTAIYSQKLNGHFILKVFDIFTETSVHLMYLLSLCWREVYIYKPKTSRPTNSEKYIICKHFRLSEENRQNIVSVLQKVSTHIKKTYSKYISFTLFKNIPDEFIQKIHKMNSDLLEQQCQCLETAITLCQDSDFLQKYEELLENSIEKRREIFRNWETNYNLNYYI